MNRAITFDVNNQRILAMQQVSHDGPVHVDITWLQHVHAHYAIPAGDMITLLNWYHYATEHSLLLFPAEQQKQPRK